MGACSDPTQDTDLRPEGPPDVLAVLVMTDASSQLAEKATFCKANDKKRPELVGLPDATTSQICPEDFSKGADEVTNAYPDGWYVRVMFDELLDPSIETLVDTTTGMPCDTTDADTTCSGTIAAAHPVDLQCTSVVSGQPVGVSYDGYYSPGGNAVTWPLGPSLVIKPNDPKAIATNTECTLTLKDNITDKDGNAVRADQRGPFKFKVAPITVIALDPPADDPDYKSPIDANTIYFDNPYVQFNTFVDIDTLCPDAGGDGLCDNEAVFSIQDVAHPTEGPGYCNTTFAPCGSLADCDAANGDTVCGRGFCTDAEDPAGGSFTPCNKAADCTDPDDACGTTYAYSYLPFGATDAEFGLGPPEPVETEHKYTFQFTAGAKLKDRCGAVTTLPTPTADNLMLAHFITNKFDFIKATIANGETASAMKRLQYNWNNVLNGHDTSSNTTSTKASTELDAAGGTEFTLSPLPEVLTAACPGGGGACTTAPIALNKLLIISADASGQIQLQGHYKMNTEYTATIKAGAKVLEFYGKSWTTTADSVIKWKTAPAIVMSAIGVRPPGLAVSTADKGTVVKPTPTSQLDIRLGFNASIDPTTFDPANIVVEPIMGKDGSTPPTPTLRAIATAADGPTLQPGDSLASGCGDFAATLKRGDNRTGYIGACTLRARGLFQAGDYKITFKKDSTVKDIFGTAYTQAADSSITITVKEAPAPVQCL